MYYTVPENKDMPSAMPMIYRDNDGAWIPADEGNSDYQQYLIWAKSNTAQVYDTANPPPVTSEPVEWVQPDDGATT
jgi:hypothetical protein